MALVALDCGKLHYGIGVPPWMTRLHVRRHFATRCNQGKQPFRSSVVVSWDHGCRRQHDAGTSLWKVRGGRRPAICLSKSGQHVDGEAMDDDDQIVGTLSDSTLWGLKLAAARAKEASRQDRLFSDPYSRYLACEEELEDLGVVTGGSSQENRADARGGASDKESRRAAAITRFLDEFLMRSVGASGKPGGEDAEAKKPQVVLVGAGMDTRPYRLPWPKGTVIFEVGPGDALQYAKDIFKAASVRVPSGCLLRQVAADIRRANAINEVDGDREGNEQEALGRGGKELTKGDKDTGKVSKGINGSAVTQGAQGCVASPRAQPSIATTDASEDWCASLVMDGYLRDRPSLWVLEGLQILDAGALTMMLADVSDMAAKGSVMAGSISKAMAVQAAMLWSEWSPRNPEQPISAQDRIRELFAEYGLQAEVIDLDATLKSIGSPVQDEDLVLFAATQKRLSLYQQEQGWKELGRAEEDGGEEGFMDMN